MARDKNRANRKRKSVVTFFNSTGNETVSSVSPWDQVADSITEIIPTAAVEIEPEPVTPLIKPEIDGSKLSFEEAMELYQTMKGFQLEPEQIEVLKLVFYSKKNLIFVAPTGFGKSIVMEFMSLIGMHYVYAGPLKSLANEKLDDLSKIAPVARDTGDDFKSRQKSNWWEKMDAATAIVTTYERHDSVLRKKSRDEYLKRMSTIVIDEFHTIANKSRGHVVEDMVIKLRKLKPNLRIIGLSATLSNSRDIAKWLNAEIVIVPESRRPVPLKFEYAPEIFGGATSQETADKAKQLVKYIKEHQELTGLTFCSSRLRASSLARDFGGFKKSVGPVAMAKQKQISFHHAGLTIKQKAKLEQMFREIAIKYMFTTTTFAMGVNLPADVAYFFNLSRWNPKKSCKELYEQDEVLQIAGRAGRRSSPSGKGVCYIMGTYEEQQFAHNAINSPHGARSRLENHLVEKVLEWIMTDIAVDTETIKEVASSSLAAHQGRLKQISITDAIKYLDTHGFIEDNFGFWKTTKLGEMTSKMYINPVTVVQVKKNFVTMIEEGKPVDHLYTYISLLETEEITDSIAVQNMDENLINAARRYMIVKQDDMTDELAKLSGYLFSDEIKKANDWLKIFLSKGDKYGMMIQTSRMISCLSAIVPHIKELKENVVDIERIAREVGLLIKNKTFNLTKLEELKTTNKRNSAQF